MSRQAVHLASRCQVGQVRQRGQLGGLMVAPRVPGTINHDVLNQSNLPQPGGSQAEADRAAALDDVGLLDHAQCRRVSQVVDRSALGVGVDAGLVSGVGLHATVPVQVVG